MVQQPPTTVSLSIADSAALSGAFRMNEWVKGFVFVPASWTAANLGFQVCATESGTYVVAKDLVGIPIQISNINTTTAAAYEIPTALFGAHWVKLWSKSTTAATETGTNQSGVKALTVILK